MVRVKKTPRPDDATRMGAANLHGRVEDRKKRRMPCVLTAGETRHNGLVIDLSRSGLFVQTSARVRPGGKLEVVLADTGAGEMKLIVEVVRRKVVPPRLLSVAQGGVGVRILEAPESYTEFLRELGIPDDTPCASQARQRFALLMRQLPGSRTKRVELEADDEASAIRIALDTLGEDWKVQSIEALD